jgi:hypothetical protein
MRRGQATCERKGRGQNTLKRTIGGQIYLVEDSWRSDIPVKEWVEVKIPVIGRVEVIYTCERTGRGKLPTCKGTGGGQTYRPVIGQVDSLLLPTCKGTGRLKRLP